MFKARRLDNLPQTKGMEIKVASKLFVKSGLELNTNFEVLSKKIFHSKVEEIKLTNKKEAAKAMNQWVCNILPLKL